MTDLSSRDQAFITKLTEIAQAHLGNEEFGVESLAREAGMSRTNLYRRLRAVKGQSISQFIRELRLHQAMDMLRNNQGTAAEISYRVGFGSPAYFNKCFHDYYGYPPGEVKKRVPGAFEDIKEGQDIGRRRLKYRRALVILTGISVALILIWLYYNVLGNIISEKSIIVLPFKNLSEEKETEYFAAGIMEDILNHLSSISDLSVRSRTTSEHIGNNMLSVKEISRQVNARYVMESSVRRYGSQLRITVQLIDARRDHHLWSENFDRDYDNIIGVQSDIALQVAQKLNAALTEDEINQIESIPTQSSEAYDNYLKGRFLLNKANAEQRADITPEGLIGSLKYFEKAIVADTNFAKAYASLANAYFNLTAWGWLSRIEGGMKKARESSIKALEVDPNCAEAHTVMGAIHIWGGEFNFEDGGKELALAIQLNPNYPVAHQWYAQKLMITGPITKARTHMDRALELEPYFWVLHTLNAWIYYFEKKYHKALEACFSAQDLKSDNISNNWLLFLSYVKLDEGLKAAEQLKSIVSSNPTVSQYTEEVIESYRKSGIEGLFSWLIKINSESPGKGQGLNGQSFYIAWWNAILGNKEESIYWLNRALKVKDNSYTYFILTATNPDFDFLRNDPRFQEIIDHIGLTPYNNARLKKQNPAT